MCGRTAASRDAAALRRIVGATRFRGGGRLRPSHNITPGQFAPVICKETDLEAQDDPADVLDLGLDAAASSTPAASSSSAAASSAPDAAQEASQAAEFLPEGCSVKVNLQQMKWGLIPFFLKDQAAVKEFSFKTFNCRSEGASQTRTFRHLVNRKRCIVPVDGFYEWHNEPGASKKKQPYFVSFGKGKVMYLAGLWDEWRPAEAAEAPAADATDAAAAVARPETLFTFTVLTCNVSQRLGWLHDRMPVVLATPEARHKWLDVDAFSYADCVELLRPYGDESLGWHKVSGLVSKRENKGADCSMPLAEYKKASLAKGIGRFFGSGRKPGGGGGGGGRAPMLPSGPNLHRKVPNKIKKMTAAHAAARKHRKTKVGVNKRHQI